MDSNLKIWSAKMKNIKEESPVVRRCRKNCIGDLGAEQPNIIPRERDTKIKDREDVGSERQKSWWSCHRKVKSPSMMSLTKSAGADCCTCCCLIAAYVKEVLRFLLRCPVDSRVSELFIEVIKMSGSVCHDCLNILKSVFRILFVIKK